MAETVHENIPMPAGLAPALATIFTNLAVSLPYDPEFLINVTDRQEKQNILEQEMFLQLGKKLIQTGKHSCMELLAPLFQIELHREFKKALDGLGDLGTDEAASSSADEDVTPDVLFAKEAAE